jgi:two-component system sensor histidine kinase KdpD
VEERRTTIALDSLSKHAVAERILALVSPEPRSQRLLRRAFHSAQRLGSEVDAVWVANRAGR